MPRIISEILVWLRLNFPLFTLVNISRELFCLSIRARRPFFIHLYFFPFKCAWQRTVKFTLYNLNLTKANILGIIKPFGPRQTEYKQEAGAKREANPVYLSTLYFTGLKGQRHEFYFWHHLYKTKIKISPSLSLVRILSNLCLTRRFTSLVWCLELVVSPTATERLTKITKHIQTLKRR